MRRPLRRSAELHAQGAGRYQIVLVHPLHRVRGPLSGEGEVEGGAQGVDVRPGVGLGPAKLLGGGVALGADVDTYEIKSLIGRGGMSTVYLAEHKRLHTRWAVKEVRANRILSPGRLQMPRQSRQPSCTGGCTNQRSR